MVIDLHLDDEVTHEEVVPLQDDDHQVQADEMMTKI
jgi:hypothetical protein